MGRYSEKDPNPDIQDAINYLDRIGKAAQADFLLTRPISIPSEIHDSLDWIASETKEAVFNFWEDQLDRLTHLGLQADTTQTIWGDAIPPDLMGGACRISTVSLLTMMRHFDLGGEQWITQFVYGFPACGIISQPGVFPHSEKADPPIPLSHVWKSTRGRFQERAKTQVLRTPRPYGRRLYLM